MNKHAIGTALALVALMASGCADEPTADPQPSDSVTAPVIEPTTADSGETPANPPSAEPHTDAEPSADVADSESGTSSNSNLDEWTGTPNARGEMLYFGPDVSGGAFVTVLVSQGAEYQGADTEIGNIFNASDNYEHLEIPFADPIVARDGSTSEPGIPMLATSPDQTLIQVQYHYLFDGYKVQVSIPVGEGVGDLDYPAILHSEVSTGNAAAILASLDFNELW